MGIDVLAPWDAFRLFATPRESYVTIPTSQVRTLAPFELRRVVLVISLTDLPGDIALSTSRTPGAGRCIHITSAQSPFVMTHDSWGPLVSVEWFAVNLGTPDFPLAVLELLLNDWPEVPRGIEHEK